VEYVGMIMQSQLGGKLLVFQSTLPSLGIGRLKLRGDDPRIYGTEKEHQLRVTEEQFYKHMAADFSKYQIGVNIYAFAERYTDLASLGKPLGWAFLYYIHPLKVLR
jgi:protein transport protein SEC24